MRWSSLVQYKRRRSGDNASLLRIGSMRISLVGCFIILALPASFTFAGDLETAMQMSEKQLAAIVPDECPAVDSACPICKTYHKWKWSPEKPIQTSEEVITQ